MNVFFSIVLFQQKYYKKNNDIKISIINRFISFFCFLFFKFLIETKIKEKTIQIIQMTIIKKTND